MMVLLLFSCAIKTSQMQPKYEKKKSNHIIEKAFIFFALLS